MSKQNKVVAGIVTLLAGVATTAVLLTGGSSNVTPTANDLSSYKPYTGQYAFGMNPGFYEGSGKWSTQQVCAIGKNIGVGSFRMLLYNNILEQSGYNCLVNDYEYITKTLGAKDLACMIGGVSPTNAWNPFNQTSTWNGQVIQEANMWKGMYEPIWKGDSINTANTFADYLKRTIDVYGKYIKFWEICNEPDFSYSNGGWLADVDPTNKSTWFYRDPAPEELINIRANVQYYIRLLRISWEVIKKYYPDSYVCTGGLGNRSFLASLLRNTDNPDSGKVTTDYPLKAGAYFDVISFHDYPEFSPLMKAWNNTTGSVDFFRHSDNLVKGHLQIKKWMDSISRLNGYDGVKMPAKQFICTETGAGRNMDGDNYGGNIVQLNYMIKTQVKTMMDQQINPLTKIAQMYWFQTGDYATQAHWDLFGLYKWFGNNTYPNAELADQGIAFKTTAALLKGKIFDTAKTKTLNLPASVDGGAFKDSSGNYVYCLWAKTTTDLSEVASATVTLPSCKRTEWNGTASNASGQVTLSATPSFFEPSVVVTPIPVPDVYLFKKGYATDPKTGKRVYFIMYSDHKWVTTNSKYVPL